jgi:regulator of nucleoside diphosphate kinase
MMKQLKKQLIIRKDDFETIMTYLKQGLASNKLSRKDVEELEAELKKAKLVNREELPADIVRLNSTVTIKDDKDPKLMEVTVVTPEKADIKQRKISIMSPIGTALLGFRKGERISWRVPAGKKTFTILEVTNPAW